ncbi:MAG: helix-turn-helix domain-containing protein, partial [Gaiellaceae bacterium]
MLAAAAGETSTGIAGRLGCSPATVGKWRTRFAER